MKIALINTVYASGSVGRIMADLYHTIEQSGNTAIVAYGRGSAPQEVYSYKIGDRVDFIRHVWHNFYRDGSGFASLKKTDELLAWLDEQQPDLLHLHNLHGFYLQIEKLFAYLKIKKLPVVWTLHDCWPYTGHCAYYDSNGCERWKVGCGDCRYHRSAYPYAIFKDNSKENFSRKRAAFNGIENLTLVTPSTWLAEEVRQSMLRQYPVRVIPNGIDLQVFQPGTGQDRKKSHKSTRTEEGRFELLGVANIWEERKGLVYLEKLAEKLSAEYHLTIVGLSPKQKRSIEGCFAKTKVTACGHTDSVQALAAYYQNADVFVNPTLEDNFPTANLEALACGTPVVTFRTGGSPETIDEHCGIVVPKGDTAKLKQAVELVCSQRRKAQGSFGAQACRQRALLFDKKIRYQEYLALYQEMLQ